MSQIKECMFTVTGMHCASCEVLIEKKLLKLDNVSSVEASTPQNSVTIEYKGDKPQSRTLNRMFSSEGYAFTEATVATPQEVSEPLFIIRDGSLSINSSKLNSILFIIFGLLGVGILYTIFAHSGLASMISVTANSALPAFFFFGLTAGFSSCAALVGGIVLSMSKQWYSIYSKNDSIMQKMEPHITFNAGRFVSFAIFGAILGAIGKVFTISPFFTSIVALIVALMMILMGLQMLGVKAFQRFQFTIPKSFSRYIADESNFTGKYMPFLMGVFTFFLPCGFTITAQGVALLSGDPIRGALMMSLFALGTSPMLLFIGISSTKLYEKAKFADNFMKLIGILVVLFGLNTINAQLQVLGIPNLSSVTINTPTLATQNNSVLQNTSTENIDGKQIVTITVQGGYSPGNIIAKAGTPTIIRMETDNAYGCERAFRIPALGISRNLPASGDTDIEIPAQKSGTTLRGTCSMGMYSFVVTFN